MTFPVPHSDRKGTTVHTPTTIRPRDYGVGGRITICVMSDDFADVILSALTDTPHDGLTVETDPVSTWVTGSEEDIAHYFSALIAAASRGGHHVVAALMLSRGCAGEIVCERTERPPVFATRPLRIPSTGVNAIAQWSLYPLDNSPVGESDHMRDIYAAIDDARTSGTFVDSDHYASRLAGDVAAIVETITAAWTAVGRRVAHVTTHATLSINSPSTPTGQAAEASR